MARHSKEIMRYAPGIWSFSPNLFTGPGLYSFLFINNYVWPGPSKRLRRKDEWRPLLANQRSRCDHFAAVATPFIRNFRQSSLDIIAHIHIYIVRKKRSGRCPKIEDWRRSSFLFSFSLSPGPPFGALVIKCHIICESGTRKRKKENAENDFEIMTFGLRILSEIEFQELAM